MTLAALEKHEAQRIRSSLSRSHGVDGTGHTAYFDSNRHSARKLNDKPGQVRTFLSDVPRKGQLARTLKK
jgi:hypothetical protein